MLFKLQTSVTPRKDENCFFARALSQACGVKPGDEVLVQSFTFCASSHPITYLGATPVFVDSEVDTWNMNPVLLEKAIKDRTEKTGKTPKAIVPVALYGMPYKVDEIMAVADRV